VIEIAQRAKRSRAVIRGTRVPRIAPRHRGQETSYGEPWLQAADRSFEGTVSRPWAEKILVTGSVELYGLRARRVFHI
jgi:hypothetical protein